MKTKFISNLKRYTFLALAVLGAFVGYSQSTQTPSIGGSKTPSTDPLGDLPFNIGGTQGAPRDTGSGMIVLSLDTKTQCIFAYPNDIGGGGKGTNTGGDTGQFDDDDFDLYNIGGRNTSGGLGLLSLNIDTGGRSTGTGTSSDTGQIHDPNDIDPYDIGGRGTNTGTGTGEILAYEIGVKSIPGDLGPGNIGTNPFDDSDDDTGGRGTDIRVGQFVMNSLNYTPGLGCDIETGGRDSGGGLIVFTGTGGRSGQGTSTSGDYGDNDDDDTGGRNSSGNTGEVYELYSWDSLPN